MSDSARTFIALELDSSLRDELGSLAARLQPQMPGARFVRPEGVHLTLRFLGATSAMAQSQLVSALADAAGVCPPTDAAVRGLGVFPERGRVRVLWVGIEVPPSVLVLQAASERAARAAGFAAEARPFRAHLTLARWREPAPRPVLPPVDLGTTRLQKLVLFRSDLRPSGAVYTPLVEMALAGAA